MTLARHVAWNTAIQILGKALSTLLGVVALGLVTRTLGTEGFGAYTTVNSFLQVFGVVVDFDGTIVKVVFDGLPMLLFTMSESEYERNTRNVKLTDIRSGTGGAWSAMQHDRQHNAVIWYI